MDATAKPSAKLGRRGFSIKDTIKGFKFDFNDPQFIGFLVAIFAVVLTYVILKLFLRQRTARRSILLLGLCDAGKTLIWSKLLYGRKADTHTSIKENVGDYQTNKGLLKIIDIPGHERLRMKFLDQYKSSARALIFVVDAMTFQKDLRDVAEFLYNILLDSVISRSNPAILILANKQDKPMAKGSSLLKTNLERELNLLRDTKDKQLDSIADKNVAHSYLGKEGKDFTFSQLTAQIDFAETSGLSDDPSGIEPVKVWLASVA
ncbi:signal recognition particle receptor subunit beta [Frankliniella occidentalis]|uniref:Signal recognition particle receptor subunit beta n=1 Tax=Frankliniella occidentalis TaxID=133901 RepID=A0A6J1S4N7_FRAOC|nr:signal recognition particle receptor subunit beta [Frankliniella occidentalis]